MSECCKQRQDDPLEALFRRCGRILYYHSAAGRRQSAVLEMLQSGPLSQKDIQERLGTTPASVSELISKLEAKEMLLRQRSDEDRRKVVLSLTERGRRSAVRHDERRSSELFSALTEAERAELLRLLQKMLADWEAQEENRV